MNQPRRRRLEIEDIGDVTLVQFVDKKILDEQNIQLIGDDLFRLVDEYGRVKVVLNFGNIQFFSSAALGKLITLHRKLQSRRGELIFCNIAKDIRDNFSITKLDKLFTICKSEQEALQHFSDTPPPLLRCPVRGCEGTIRPATPAQLLRWNCPECRSTVLFDVLPTTTGRVDSVELGTYDSESVRAAWHQRYWAVCVVGRLDLFAAEQLEKLWQSLPEPRRVLLDLNGTTELSRGGADILSRLASTTERLLTVVPGATKLDTSLLPPGAQRSASRSDATKVITEGLTVSQSPLSVSAPPA